MKNITLFLFNILILGSCSNTSYPKFNYNSSPNPWIAAFKDQVFFASLRESYKSDSIFMMIEKKDAFNPYDGLSLEDIKKAKNLGRNLVINMPLPAMCEGCKNGENYYMAHCLHYYASRELDSIARGEYKKRKKEDKKVLAQ